MEKENITLKLERTCFRNGVVDGVLTDDSGERVCDTVENVRNMLPFGTYELELHLNLEQGIAQFAVYKYPHGAQQLCWLKTGNGAYNLKDGSIIVGESLVHGVVKKSRENFEKIMNRTANGADLLLRV